MQERRQHERFLLNLPVRWESLFEHGRGTVCDLSAGGCFVLSGATIDRGEMVRLKVDFGNDSAIAWGRVVYTVAEMGFALEFLFSDQTSSAWGVLMVARASCA